MEEKPGIAEEDGWNWEALGAVRQVSGRLVVRLEGRPITVRGDETCLKLDLPDLATGRRLLGVLPSRDSGEGRGGGLRRLLSATGLQVEIRVAGRKVAVLRGDSKPGFLARMLGLGPARIHPLSLFLSAFGRHRIRRDDDSETPP